MQAKEKVVVVFSGGMDSAALGLHYHRLGREVLVISFDYGQRHGKELLSAKAIADQFGWRHEVVNMAGVSRLLRGSSQTDRSVPVPHGHYAEETMKQTVVPNRNMMMLSVAAGWALSEGAPVLAFGAHAGDHTIYPDCRSQFITALRVALGLADWREVRLEAPFVTMTKAEIASLGHLLGVPWHMTWSCYEGGALHCGQCGTCVERKEAFTNAGIQDPTAYAR